MTSAIRAWLRGLLCGLLGHRSVYVRMKQNGTRVYGCAVCPAIEEKR